MHAHEVLLNLIKKAVLNATLQPQQQRVVDKIQQPDVPGLLVYHGLGSGKTLTSIAAADALGGNANVVAPAALRTNYAKELKKYRKGPSDDFRVRSYQDASTNGIPDAAMTIFDEAHRTGRADSAMSQLPTQAKGKVLLLTGTPVRNEPSELLPLLRAIAPDRKLPGSAEAFDEKFVGHDVHMPNIIKRLFGARPHATTYIKNQDQLRDLLRGRVDYHPSGGEFPTVNEEVIGVDMSREQQKLYKALTKASPRLSYKVRMNLPPDKRDSKQLNAFMGAARQISNAPSSYDTRLEGHSPKMQRMLEELLKHHASPEGKSVVYSNYLDSGISPLAKSLQEKGIPNAVFSGALSDKQRQEIVNNYNTGKIRSLLLSGAGAEGLDLKGTRLVQLMEPHWNKSRIDQVIGRAVRHRSHAALPEDQRNVKVQRFFARPRPGILSRWFGFKRDTGADEYLYDMSERKQRLIGQLNGILQEVGSEPAKAAEWQPAIGSALSANITKHLTNVHPKTWLPSDEKVLNNLVSSLPPSSQAAPLQAGLTRKLTRGAIRESQT